MVVDPNNRRCLSHCLSMVPEQTNVRQGDGTRFNSRLNVMEISLNSIPNALETREGLPRPDWQLVQIWIDSHNTEDDLNVVWTQLARDWINALIHALPDGYTLSESAEFMLVCKGDSRFTDRLLNWCEKSRRTILDTLKGVASDEGFGKHVVLAFEDPNTYYDYITDFYPEQGEFALSRGVFLDDGYGHFAFCTAYGDEHERTIAHELNHSLLGHLPLPMWLNEGVTQEIEDAIVGNSYFSLDTDMVRKHREYWNSETIHSFWAGDSFSSPDDGRDLSYQLSRLLFRNVIVDYPNHIFDFLNTAHYADAGNSALIAFCGTSLCDRVVQFMGSGEWSPRADYFSGDE